MCGAGPITGKVELPVFCGSRYRQALIHELLNYMNYSIMQGPNIVESVFACCGFANVKSFMTCLGGCYGRVSLPVAIRELLIVSSGHCPSALPGCLMADSLVAALVFSPLFYSFLIWMARAV